ncbi:hypothetical protein [Phocaeicola sp.]
MITKNCKIPHDGFSDWDRSHPSRADLRVCTDFSMPGSQGSIKITCTKKDIKFRFREDIKGPTDKDLYDGKYFSDGDIVPYSNIGKIYISDPKKKGESISSLPTSYSFDVSLEHFSGIICDLSNKGYHIEDINNPAKADLRVSDDFNMAFMPDVMKIKINYNGKSIKIRIRENHMGTTDYDAYNQHLDGDIGRYFTDGDYIPRSSYDKLYISDPKFVDPANGTLSTSEKFTVEFESVTPKNNLRFLVSSDLHLCGSPKDKGEDTKHDTDVNNLNKLLGHITQLGLLDFYAVCGDLSYGSRAGDESMFIDDFFNRVNRETVIPCVCEGWGNHDVWRMGGNRTNIQNGIRDRNQSYSQRLLMRNYSLSDNKYHYHWSYALGDNEIHFLMLNDVPGYGEIKQDPPHDGFEIDEKNPYNSLKFLSAVIENFTEKDFYVLFYHINFAQKEIEDNTPDKERWWSKESMKQFAEVIKASKGKYMASFFGHYHTIAGTEILKTGICQDLTGYRCACSDQHGAAHYWLAEIDLENNIPVLTASAYSNAGIKEDIEKDRYVDISDSKKDS